MLGQGSQGVVLHAFPTFSAMLGLPDSIAVKKLQIISPTTGPDIEVILKLRKELEIMKRLKHENVVKYYGCEMIG